METTTLAVIIAVAILLVALIIYFLYSQSKKSSYSATPSQYFGYQSDSRVVAGVDPKYDPLLAKTARTHQVLSGMTDPETAATIAEGTAVGSLNPSDPALAGETISAAAGTM